MRNLAGARRVGHIISANRVQSVSSGQSSTTLSTVGPMQPKANYSRKSAVVHNSRWLAYATAGAATAIAGTHSAEGTIHYSGPIHYQLNGDSAVTLPLEDGAVLGFRHRPPYSYSIFNQFGGSAFFDIGGSHAAVASICGFYKSCNYNPEDASVTKLERGDVVSMQSFAANSGIVASGDEFNCYGRPRGQFTEPGYGFVGFKFNNGHGNQYGWARIRALGLIDNKIEIIDYAYGDVGDKIRAGQRAGGHDDVGLESLGGLALAAAGLLAWRKRKE